MNSEQVLKKEDIGFVACSLSRQVYRGLVGTVTARLNVSKLCQRLRPPPLPPNEHESPKKNPVKKTAPLRGVTCASVGVVVARSYLEPKALLRAVLQNLRGLGPWFRIKLYNHAYYYCPVFIAMLLIANMLLLLGSLLLVPVYVFPYCHLSLCAYVVWGWLSPELWELHPSDPCGCGLERPATRSSATREE